MPLPSKMWALTGTLLPSWTFITWIVVIGSSLVMLLWVVIYSYLPANNFFTSTGAFVYEVEVLFSNVTFWATVFFSVFVALGEWAHSKRILAHVSDSFPAPRFLYKSASSAYAPLDKDIVREMWVTGDLKDRLGIRHRKASKNMHITDLESAPMFRQPHARSASELNVSQAYEPTHVPSELDMNEKPPSGYADDAIDVDVERTRTLPLISVGSSEMAGERASYYSPSDIPVPSPIPPPLYRFPNGEVRQKPSRGATSTSIPPLSEQGYQRSTPLAPEAFEMQVRHPPLQPQSPPASSPSHSPAGSQGFHPPYSTSGFQPDEGSRPSSWTGGRAV